MWIWPPVIDQILVVRWYLHYLSHSCALCALNDSYVPFTFCIRLSFFSVLPFVFVTKMFWACWRAIWHKHNNDWQKQRTYHNRTHINSKYDQNTACIAQSTTNQPTQWVCVNVSTKNCWILKIKNTRPNVLSIMGNYIFCTWNSTNANDQQQQNLFKDEQKQHIFEQVLLWRLFTFHIRVPCV